MAENNLKQTKPTTGAKAPATVSKPTAARAATKPVEKPATKPTANGASSVRRPPVQGAETAPKSANGALAASKTAPVAPKTAPAAAKTNITPSAKPAQNSLDGQTISSRQTPIVPNSSLSETAQDDKQDKKKKKIEQRLKSSNISMDDLEQINEQNLRQYRSRVTRNRFVIITLVILLVAAIASFAVVIAVRRMANNCTVKVNGDVDAEFIINGERLTKFRTPLGVQGNRVYMIDTDIEIKSSGNYNVYFTVEVFQSGEKLRNTFAYEYNHDLFHMEGDGKYSSNDAIAGGQTINLFEGVVLDDAYETSLNNDNFTMKINIYFERA